MQRRLAAILAADVVGYSRLMQQDEVGTLAALKERQKGILQPLVANHSGRIVKVIGDGVLVEFASAVNAVACAVALQQRMASANASLPGERHIVLRIGINLGDVMIEGGDLYGDGVNIAARLERIAEPGGILISGTTYDQVKNKVDVEFDDLGTPPLRNIAEAVRAYRVANTPLVSATVPKTAKGDLSIAVLPFSDMSGDPEQQYFSDGITEDIITELSYFRQLLVIARNSSFQYRGTAVDIRRVARELSVQYILEGSVRKAGNRVRVTAQLINGLTGNHVWAERYDRDLYDILDVQAELAHAIAARVSGRADRLERTRALDLDPGNLRAYDRYLRGRELLLRLTPADNRQARLELQAAIELAPMMAEAYAELGQTYVVDHLAWWVEDRNAALVTALDLGKRSVSLDERSSRCRWTLGIAHLFRGDYDEARLHLETGIALNPNDTRVRAIYGVYLTAVNRVDEAIRQYEVAAELDPRDENWIPWLRGSALFVARRYVEAIDSFKQMVNPINEARGWLAASLAYAGRLTEAATVLDEFLRTAESEMVTFPGRRLKEWEPYWQGTTQFQHRADLDHLLGGLHKAGLAL